MKKTILAATLTSIFLSGCGSDIEKEIIENLAPEITLEQVDYEITENSSLEVNIDISDEIGSDIQIDITSSLNEITTSFENNILTITTGEVTEDVFGTVTITATDPSGLSASANLNVTILDGEVVVTEGVITGFGSVFVDGVEYETDGADFEVNDEDSDESNLEVGMVIKLKGLAKSNGVGGIASSIVFSDTVRGVIEEINLEENTFTVMGQIVSFNDETNFNNVTSEELSSGNVVVVSGNFDDEDRLVASFISKKADTIDLDIDKVYRLKGEVSDLDTTNMTFTLGAMVVDYSNAEVEIDEEADSLTNGSLVKVKGRDIETNSTVGELLFAEKVKVEAKLLDTVGENFVVEGYVSDVDFENNIFVIKNHEVSFGLNTKFLLGNSDMLSEGLRVGVKLVKQGEDSVFAESVVFFHRPNVFVEGEVSDINVEENSFSVAGLDFMVTNRTKFEDDSDLDVKYFNLEDLSLNDYVDVKGVKFYLSELSDDSIAFLGLDAETNAEYVVLTTSVERDNSDEDSGVLELEGLIKINENNEVVMLDKVISFDGKSVIKHDGLEVTQEEMIQIVKELSTSGVEVKAEVNGFYDGQILHAFEMDFEIKEFETRGKITVSESGTLLLNDLIVDFHDESEIKFNGEEISIEELFAYINENENDEITLRVAVIGYQSGDLFVVSKMRVLETENIIVNGLIEFNDDNKLVFDGKKLMFNDFSKIVSGNLIITLKELYGMIEQNNGSLKVNLKGDLLKDSIIVKELTVVSGDDNLMKAEGKFSINQNNSFMIGELSFETTSDTVFSIAGDKVSEETFRQYLTSDGSEVSGHIYGEKIDGVVFANEVIGKFVAVIQEAEGTLSADETGQVFFDQKQISFHENAEVYIGEQGSKIDELRGMLKQGELFALVKYEETISGLVIRFVRVRES